jgi:hypothetical protein
MHHLDTALSRDGDQSPHQQSSQPLVLPLVTDGDYKFTVCSIWQRAKASYTNFAFFCANRDQGHEGRVSGRVDNSQLP